MGEGAGWLAGCVVPPSWPEQSPLGLENSRPKGFHGARNFHLSRSTFGIIIIGAEASSSDHYVEYRFARIPSRDDDAGAYCGVENRLLFWLQPRTAPTRQKGLWRAKRTKRAVGCA